MNMKWKDTVVTTYIILVSILLCFIVLIAQSAEAKREIQKIIFGESFQTKLYDDGTLIIDESSLDAKQNKLVHGTILKIYPSFHDSPEKYILSKNEDSLWNKEIEQIKKVYIGSVIYPQSCAKWFFGCNYLEYCNVEKLDTRNVVSMRYMFCNAGSLSNTFVIEGMNKWDVGCVKEMNWMFRAAGFNSKTFDLGDLSTWNVSNVKDMSYMFDSAGKYADKWNIGEISNWNVSNTNSFERMFGYAAENTTNWNMGDLYSWNVEGKNVDNMFLNEKTPIGYKFVPKYIKDSYVASK
ncbi:MAG: BspA family leucine-rich repeat surface protein [Bacillota bacterium]|nr:BspA family leucine-rich repeat surface protein [Bacillota bacterium]